MLQIKNECIWKNWERIVARFFHFMLTVPYASGYPLNSITTYGWTVLQLENILVIVEIWNHLFFLRTAKVWSRSRSHIYQFIDKPLCTAIIIHVLQLLANAAVVFVLAILTWNQSITIQIHVTTLSGRRICWDFALDHLVFHEWVFLFPTAEIHRRPDSNRSRWVRNSYWSI